MGFAFGYGRVSTGKQRDSGLSQEAQEERCKKWFEILKLRFPDIEWGETYFDGGVSGFKKPLAERAAGGRLLGRLANGDHVIMTRLDRGWRKVVDALTTIDAWQARGITVHLLDLGLDTSSPLSRMLLTILAAVAEYERESARERTAIVMAMRKKRDPSAPMNQHAGYGRKLEGPRNNKRVVADPAEQKQIEMIVSLKDGGMAFKDIYFGFLKQGQRTRRGVEWSESRIKRAYYFATKKKKARSRSARSRCETTKKE